MTVGLVATLKVKEGVADAFEIVFRELTAAVRANEPGNIQYNVFRSRREPGTYIAVEIYQDDLALQAHNKSDHFRAAGPKITSLLSEKPQIMLYDSI